MKNWRSGLHFLNAHTIQSMRYDGEKIVLTMTCLLGLGLFAVTTGILAEDMGIGFVGVGILALVPISGCVIYVDLTRKEDEDTRHMSEPVPVKREEITIEVPSGLVNRSTMYDVF